MQSIIISMLSISGICALFLAFPGVTTPLAGRCGNALTVLTETIKLRPAVVDPLWTQEAG